jgi:hypothetical protein
MSSFGLAKKSKSVGELPLGFGAGQRREQGRARDEHRMANFH